MLTFFVTQSTLPAAQAAAESLLAQHPTSVLLLITSLLFGLAELLRRFRRPVAQRSVERTIALAKTGESS
jgi:hypothetical protein